VSNPEPILKLNVASLLRKNWEDPLHAYLSNGEEATTANRSHRLGFHSEWGDKENDEKVGNKSSFQEVYHRHLEKLNQASRPKKLSLQAKQTILRNLAKLHGRVKG
jgi:hypothetical protein